MKIFSDRAYVPEGVDHIWQLSPFWGETARESKSAQPNRFARYTQEAPAMFRMTGLAEAEVAVFPAEFQQCHTPPRRVSFERFVALAAEAGNPVLVFTGGDLEHDLPPFECYEFHTALYRSKMMQNAFAMPPAIVDVTREAQQGRFSVLRKE